MTNMTRNRKAFEKSPRNDEFNPQSCPLKKDSLPLESRDSSRSTSDFRLPASISSPSHYEIKDNKQSLLPF